jgi:hypothetical protein
MAVLVQHHQCKVLTVATITARHHSLVAVVAVVVRSVLQAVVQGFDLTVALVYKQLLKV